MISDAPAIDGERFIAAEDVLDLDPPDAVDRVVEVAGLMAVFAAERLLSVALLHADARRRAAGMSAEILDRSVRLELASALRVTEYAAGELLAMADAVVHRYPMIYDLLHEARITEQHARVLVDCVDAVEPEHRDTVLAGGVELAVELPVGSFRRAIRARVERVRSTTLAQRHAEAVIGRRVVVEQVADGMSWLHALIPTVEAHAIHDRLTRIGGAIRGRAAGPAAEGAEPEARTLDQVRADALCDLLIDGDTPSHPDTARGIRASVVVTVPVLSLLTADTAAEPATIDGVGPISMDRARELCGGADGWMRVLTHPETGMVLSVGRDRYTPPPALRNLAKWRSARCMAPGCGVPASRCQIDHTVAWEHGGATALSNSAPLCQGHHTIKHHGDWAVRQCERSGGALEWTSPTGRRYVVAPERPVPVFRPSEQSPPF
ncbi:DUF222 domain-containing protein [Microbacterium sp.]|uniref:HNH endonuclease signature motif containing protein n=1 Tax=Microbacterium sp. TaxID=51671 RepID=UPI003F706024